MVGCLQENQAVPKDQISAHEAAQNSGIWMLGSRSAWHSLLAFLLSKPWQWKGSPVKAPARIY